MPSPKKTPDPASLPIGVFDSGVGGLTVMKAIIETLPNESVVYYGDTARLPYGDKSPQTIFKYTQEGINFLASYPVKLAVLACNTASAYSAEKLREQLKIPLVDVIQPSAQAAALSTRNQKIAVLGTHATIRSRCYEKAIKNLSSNTLVLPVACPLLVPLVEEGLVAHEATNLLVQDYLKPVISTGCDTVILGCTHYPLLKEVIKIHLPVGTVIIDSASCCAKTVCRLLEESQAPSQASYDFIVTDDSERFRNIASRLLEKDFTASNVRLLAEQHEGCIETRSI